MQDLFLSDEVAAKEDGAHTFFEQHRSGAQIFFLVPLRRGTYFFYN